MGTPGSIDLDSGVLRNSNTLCLNGLRIEEWIETALGQAVTVENDANCFALAEARLGAGRGSRVVFGVILGTGCGAGLVVDGRLHVGPNRLAGEWGHLSIDSTGPLCWCGQRGCLETQVSGGGLSERWLEQTGERLSAQAILRDPRPANRIFTERWIEHICRGLKGVVQTIDPDAIVLGGGLSNHLGLAEAIGRGLAGTLFGSTDCRTPVLVNRLGDSAGVFGAVLRAQEQTHLASTS
jgi:fructokinase